MSRNLVLVVGLAALAGCTSHKVEVAPVEVKPIHITMDINVRVQKELDSFFDFEKEVAAPKEPGSAPEGGADGNDNGQENR